MCLLVSSYYSNVASCVSYVLVHNSGCVEQTVLVQTHTKDNADKNSRSGGGQGQGFRMMQLVVCMAFTFCLQA